MRTLPRRLALALATTIGLVLLVAAPASATGRGASNGNGNAAGNNGTIKIDEQPIDAGNDNDPHVACAFEVEFFGYDAGNQTATLTFEGQPPTGGGTLLQDSTSWTTATRTSGNQFDAALPVDLHAALADVTPQPQQGDHVELTVDVTGAQGSDVKHKVFWVQGCAPAAPTVAPTVAPMVAATQATQARQTLSGGGASFAAPAPAVAAAQAAAPAPGAHVLGNQVGRGAAQVAPASLARTGFELGGLLGAAIACLLGGTALVRRARRA